MGKEVKFSFTIKIIGAVVGSIGFFLTASGKPVLGATLIGMGSFIIAIGVH